MNKLKFWKKDDGFDFDKELSKDINMKDDDILSSAKDPMSGDRPGSSFDFDSPAGGFGQQQKSSFGQDSFSQGPSPQRSPGQTQNFTPSNYPPSQPSYIGPAQQESPYASYGAPSMQASHEQIIMTKNLEIISSKLESLRASLESINQRLANLERVALGDSNNRRGWM